MLDALVSAIGRFPKTVPMLAAHAPATKSVVPPSEAFPSYKGLFIGFLVGVVLIVGGLAFAPAFAVGPWPETWRCQRLLSPDWKDIMELKNAYRMRMRRAV